MYDLILKNFHLTDKEVINIYSYGSRVYGTHSESSDHDFIIIVNKDVHEFDLMSIDKKINVHLYSTDAFANQLEQHKIAALECFFLPTKFLLKNKLKFTFDLNKEKLRSSISEKASHSWVKAKKKFEIEADRNIYIAKKSLFHSIRIIDFGIQIAKYNKIIDYSSSNNIWEDIMTDPKEKWNHFENKFKLFFNSQMTEFRKLAPK